MGAVVAAGGRGFSEAEEGETGAGLEKAVDLKQ